MNPSLKYRIGLSLVIIIFLLFIVGFIQPWLIIKGLFGLNRVLVSDPIVNPRHIANLFHEMQISKEDINILLSLILASSILYIIAMISILGGVKDLRSLIVSGGIGIASGIMWIIMYNYLVNLFPKIGSPLINLTIWPYLSIVLGAVTIITYIFLK